MAIPPEYPSHYSSANLTGTPVNDNATRFPDASSNTPDAWEAKVGTHNAGYIAKGLLTNTEQQDGFNTYYVKLRIRLDNTTPLTHTPVVTVSAVRVSDGAIKSATIYADQFGGYTYTEITALSFTKSKTGTLSVSAQPASTPAASDPYTIGPTGFHTDAAAPGTAFDYQVYWPGQVTCYLDYIIIDDVTGNSVFGGSYNTLIDQEVNYFKTQSALGRYKIRDEIRGFNYGQYLCTGYVDGRIKATSTKAGSHYCNSYWDGANYIGRDIAWTSNNQLMADIYPLSGNIPLPISPSYTQTIQSQIQSQLIQYLQWNITYANKYSVPFWYTPQAHYWEDYNSHIISLREPTPNEHKMLVYLGLAYGAKGIMYFMHKSQNDWVYNGYTCYGLVNVDGSKRTTIYPGTTYEGSKWDTIKAINQKLAGSLGQTLLNLTWQGAYSIHLSPSLAGTYVTSITTGDPVNQTYVELALFTDAASNKYFMLVNRRTIKTENRTITVAFNNTTSWEISDVASGNVWIIAPNGSFTDNFDPGSGKLYRIAPATWNGTKNITNTVTILSGATLIVSPGATISFASGAQLIVNGALNANGISSNRITFDFITPNSTTKNGIKFNSGSGGGTLSFCTIKNGYNGVYCTGSNSVPTINKCRISNNTIGIYMDVAGTPSQPPTNQISYNGIMTNSSYGIYLYNSSPTNICYDTITNNMYGIRCETSSAPFLYYNIIKNNSVGVFCSGSSGAHLANSSGDSCGHNVLKYNGTGLSAAYGSGAFLGSTIKRGLNSISDDTLYAIVAAYTTTVYAQYNWWNRTQDSGYCRASDFSIQSGSSIIYRPAYGPSNPNAGMGKASVMAYSDPGSDEFQVPFNDIAVVSDTTQIYDPEFEDALNNMDKGKFDLAITKYLNKFKKENNTGKKLYALEQLSACYRLAGKDDFVDLLDREIRPGLSKKSVLYATTLKLENLFLISDGRYDKAIENYTTLRNNFAGNEDIYKQALFNLWYLYYNKLGDTLKAKGCFSELQTKYPDDDMTLHCRVLLGEIDAPRRSTHPKGNALGKGDASSKVEVPDKYALFENYPNPFNPTTSIVYQLPKEGFVTIRVCDVLGREIATLVNQDKKPGKYSVEFNASSLSSGMYFYQLKVNDFISTKKMMLVK